MFNEKLEDTKTQITENTQKNLHMCFNLRSTSTSDLTDLTTSRASVARFAGRLCFPKYVGGRPAFPLSPLESCLQSCRKGFVYIII